MDNYDASEQAYKNGYSSGYEAGRRSAVGGDVVSVVRCGKCKHFGGHGACHCHAADENGTPIFVREDDFCSYGERKVTDG